MTRLPVRLEANGRTTHDYDVYINMPEGLECKGHEAIIGVWANNRTQAAALAKREGYVVRSVNMVG